MGGGTPELIDFNEIDGLHIRNVTPLDLGDPKNEVLLPFNAELEILDFKKVHISQEARLSEQDLLGRKHEHRRQVFQEVSLYVQKKFVFH